MDMKLDPAGLARRTRLITAQGGNIFSYNPQPSSATDLICATTAMPSTRPS